MTWRYYIRDGENQLVKSEGGFVSEQDAMSAGEAYAEKMRLGFSSKGPGEVFTISAGREKATQSHAK